MAVDATNPLLTTSDMDIRRFDMVDGLLELRAPGEAAESTTASETGVSFAAEANCYYKAVVDHAAIGGTVDGSNYWVITIEASDNNSDWVEVGSTGILGATADRLYVSLEGQEIAAKMAAAGEGEAIYLRCTATETGTTAGDLDYNAFLTK